MVLVFVVRTLIVAGCVQIVLPVAVTTQTATCTGASLFDVLALCEQLKLRVSQSLLLGLWLVKSPTLTKCKVRSRRKGQSTSSLNVPVSYLKMQFGS